MEGLLDLINMAVRAGQIRGACVGSGEFRLYHLIYADNVVFVTDLSTDAIPNMSKVLKEFQDMSGLNINIHK